MQLQQAYDMIRFIGGVFIQATGVLIAADSVLLGYGLSQRQAVFLLIACAVPVLMLLVQAIAVANLLPIVFVALSLERSIVPDSPTLVASYLGAKRLRLPKIFMASTPQTIDAFDVEEVRRSFKASPWLRGPAVAVMLLMVAGHVAIFCVSWLVFDFPLA